MSDTPNVTPVPPAEPAPGTRAPLSAIDLVAFVCEILAFGTLALWGFTMWPFPWNIVAGIAAPCWSRRSPQWSRMRSTETVPSFSNQSSPFAEPPGPSVQ